MTFGVTLFSVTEGLEKKSIDRADKALYIGKKKQRNCVVVD